MKKIAFVILFLIIGFCAALFCERYLGLSLRSHGAPINCQITTNIDDVVKCINLNYMKFDAYTGDWNNNLAKNYMSSRINRLYQDTNMEFSQFHNIKECSEKNNCKIHLRDENYNIDSYKDLVAYIRLKSDPKGYTYNRSNSFWNNFPVYKIWRFNRSYKFPYHDVVISQKNDQYVFYVLSMEAVPLSGSYDLLIGSLTAFCSADKFSTSKKYICGGYRFYFYDEIDDEEKNFSLSLDKRVNPEYALIQYGKASYKVHLDRN